MTTSAPQVLQGHISPHMHHGTHGKHGRKDTTLCWCMLAARM